MNELYVKFADALDRVTSWKGLVNYMVNIIRYCTRHDDMPEGFVSDVLKFIWLSEPVKRGRRGQLYVFGEPIFALSQVLEDSLPLSDLQAHGLANLYVWKMAEIVGRGDELEDAVHGAKYQGLVNTLARKLGLSDAYIW